MLAFYFLADIALIAAVIAAVSTGLLHFIPVAPSLSLVGSDKLCNGSEGTESVELACTPVSSTSSKLKTPSILTTKLGREEGVDIVWKMLAKIMNYPISIFFAQSLRQRYMAKF